MVKVANNDDIYDHKDYDHRKKKSYGIYKIFLYFDSHSNVLPSFYSDTGQLPKTNFNLFLLNHFFFSENRTKPFQLVMCT